VAEKYALAGLVRRSVRSDGVVAIESASAAYKVSRMKSIEGDSGPGEVRTSDSLDLEELAIGARTGAAAVEAEWPDDVEDIRIGETAAAEGDGRGGRGGRALS